MAGERHAVHWSNITGPFDDDPDIWISPFGPEWDLRVQYIDQQGNGWHWAGGFSVEDDVLWPLFSRDDYRETDVIPAGRGLSPRPTPGIPYPGDDEPERRTRPRHLAVVTVAVDFVGTYYEPREMVGMVEDWVSSALHDRDNVRGFTISGHVIELPDVEDEEG